MIQQLKTVIWGTNIRNHITIISDNRTKYYDICCKNLGNKQKEPTGDYKQRDATIKWNQSNWKTTVCAMIRQKRQTINEIRGRMAVETDFLIYVEDKRTTGYGYVRGAEDSCNKQISQV